MRKVIPDLNPSVDFQSEVHYVNRTKVKDVTPSEIIRALELVDDNHVSQDDLKFLSKLKEAVTVKCHYHFARNDLTYRTTKHVQCTA